jgi:hypothetical protein
MNELKGYLVAIICSDYELHHPCCRVGLRRCQVAECGVDVMWCELTPQQRPEASPMEITGMIVMIGGFD